MHIFEKLTILNIMKFLNHLIYLFLFCFINLAISQDKNISVINISDILKENANIVVRKNHKEINIISQNKMITNEVIHITFLNELGWKNFGIGEYYDKSDKIRSIEAIVYNANGKEIKKIRRSDFKDHSVADGFSVYTDNRMLSLDYTPTSYPFSIKYSSVVETPNTAFIPMWLPITSLFTSIEEGSITINYPSDLGFRYKEYNFENYFIKTTTRDGSVSFSLKNFPALKNEDYTPSIINFTPYVRFALQKFHLEGVSGEASTWEDLGNWINTSFLVKTNDLPEATKEKIRELVKDKATTREKAEKIYKYVQDRTRYVSVQLGIGGWKPMNAKDVDRLGYGDCKALTNYTKALLDAVGIRSYYSIIHNSQTKRDMTPDFVSMQGNHVILAIPNEDNDSYWLECTSQTIPFNFIGGSNDDRLVLSINEGESTLRRTQVYETDKNSQSTLAQYSIDQKGNIEGVMHITTKGIQYGSRFYLERQPLDQINRHYKNYFSYINNLELKEINFTHDTQSLNFTENISLKADNYTDISGERMIFVVNAFNQYRNTPQRYRSRTNPFEITRGFSDYDEFIIILPDGYDIEALPNNVEIESKFGFYKAEFSLVDDHKVIYKRTLISHEGFYPKEDYESFRNFREQVSRNDNAKVVMIKQ